MRDVNPARPEQMETRTMPKQKKKKRQTPFPSVHDSVKSLVQHLFNLQNPLLAEPLFRRGALCEAQALQKGRNQRRPRTIDRAE